MTKIYSTLPEQQSAFTSAFVNVLTGAVVVLAGILTFAQFVNI